MPGIQYLSIFLSGFTATVLLTILFRWLAVKWSFIDHPSERKFHKKPTPLLGGAAIFIGFWVALFWTNAGFSQSSQRAEWLAVIFIGGLVISGAGLWDDKLVLSAWRKLFFQIIAALFTVLAGIRAKIFLPEPLSYIISFFWILIITNAFNLLDNMDGVCSGIAFISSLLLFFTGIVMENALALIITSALMGVTLGFLCFNFPPASIFMGDCGSMFIGYLVSVVTILGTYYKPESPTLFPVVIPILVLAVPLFDVFSVIFIRIAQGRLIFKPDKNHFSHRLVNMGMNVKTAVLFLYLITFCVGLPSILLPILPLCGVLVVFIQTLVIMSIIAIFEYYVAR